MDADEVVCVKNRRTALACLRDHVVPKKILVECNQISITFELIAYYTPMIYLFIFLAQFFYVLVARITKHLYLNIVVVNNHFLEEIHIPYALMLAYLLANNIICKSDNGEVFCFVCLLFCFFLAVERRKLIVFNPAFDSFMVMICQAHLNIFLFDDVLVRRWKKVMSRCQQYLWSDQNCSAVQSSNNLLVLIAEIDTKEANHVTWKGIYTLSFPSSVNHHTLPFLIITFLQSWQSLFNKERTIA